MTKVTWDTVGKRIYETGVDQGVLYVSDAAGVPWNGLVSVEEQPDGGEQTSYWLDGIKYLDTIGVVDYKATISAITYPDEFEACIGTLPVQTGILATAQPQGYFGLAYRTKVGNDVAGNEFAYKIHLVYNAVATPTSRNYQTLGSETNPIAFQWDITAVPVPTPGRKPTAHFIFDSRTLPSATMSLLQDLIYGKSDRDAHLPIFIDLLELIQTGTSITIVDNGDGSWTAIGPADYLIQPGDGTFEIDNANAIFLDSVTYEVSST